MAEGMIRSIERAIDILQAFSQENSSLSLSDICRLVDLPKTTVFRIINTLEDRNLLFQDPVTGKYLLGYELIHLGEEAQSSNDLAKLAYRSMEHVSLVTRQTCNLYVRQGFERVCIAQVTGSEYVRKYSYLGAHHPLYCGAGKLLLAYSDPDFLKTYFSTVKLLQYTKNTITDLTLLQEELNRVREQGYSVSLGERDDISAAVAVPVFNYSNQVVAALTISGPIYYFTTETIQEYVDVLTKEALELSQKLGH